MGWPGVGSVAAAEEEAAGAWMDVDVDVAAAETVPAPVLGVGTVGFPPAVAAATGATGVCIGVS